MVTNLFQPAVNPLTPGGTYNPNTGVYTNPQGQGFSTAFQPSGSTTVTDTHTHSHGGGGSSYVDTSTGIGYEINEAGVKTIVPPANIQPGQVQQGFSSAGQAAFQTVTSPFGNTPTTVTGTSNAGFSSAAAFPQGLNQVSQIMLKVSLFLSYLKHQLI
jgi:hypothetical protein